MENFVPEAIEEYKLEGVMSQITFFGQNPYKLFHKEHPRKKMKNQGFLAKSL